MKITKLHLILLAIVGVVLGFYVYQLRLEREQLQAQAAAMAAREARQKRAEEERRRLADLAKKQDLAVQAVAVAGEYYVIARKEGKDASQGQKVLHDAKELLAAQQFDQAYVRARESIDLFKAAPQAKRASRTVRYTVRRGDTLWRIARMPKHYGRGSRWPLIWRANKKQIPDFDLIRPRQTLLIPKARTIQRQTS